MKKLFFTLLLSLSTISYSYAEIKLPTFYAHEKERKLFGEQIYNEAVPSEILWQLNYWSRHLLCDSALSQALNDVISERAKYSGVVIRDKVTHGLYHSSAGKGDKTATLFYIFEEQGLTRVIGIGKHNAVKPNQAPSYALIAWDERYTIVKTDLRISN